MLTDYEVDESLSLTANLKQAFRKVEWLSLPYRRVNLLMADKRFTFIPLEYFEDEQADTIFYHNFSQQENETVLYNILHKDNIVVLFAWTKAPSTICTSNIPKPISMRRPVRSSNTSLPKAGWETTGKCT